MIVGASTAGRDWQRPVGLALVLIAVGVFFLPHLRRSTTTSYYSVVLGVRVSEQGDVSIDKLGEGLSFDHAGAITIAHAGGNPTGFFGRFIIREEAQWTYEATRRPPIPIDMTLLETAFEQERVRIAHEMIARPEMIPLARLLRLTPSRTYAVHWTNVISVLNILAFVVGCVLLVVPSRADRRRQRALVGRCTACGYSQQGLTKGVCPECGHNIASVQN